MRFERATLTRAELEEALSEAKRYPHGNVHKGELIIAPAAFETPGRETNLVISRFAILDCTGSIHVGPWCNIGPRTRIYTHDTIHYGRRPLFEWEETHGVSWQDKYIGSDVWIHDGSIVLYQVTEIPDGVVLGAGSVLTKNPGPFEIWAGNPARKVGTREPMDSEEIARRVNRNQFRLDGRNRSGR